MEEFDRVDLVCKTPDSICSLSVNSVPVAVRSKLALSGQSNMANKAELRQFIMTYFSDDELNALCFDYFPEVLNNSRPV